jgi:hypothetical protein
VSYVERQPARKDCHRFGNPDPFIHLLDNRCISIAHAGTRNIVMATNNEDHDGGYVNDLLNTQHIADETVAYLRSLKKDLQITTGKIEPFIIKAIRKLELLKKVAEHDEKLAEHDNNWLELAKASKGFNQITSALERMTRKK